MIETIANYLKETIIAENLQFIDKIGGLIRPVSYDGRDSENNVTTITLPVSCDYSPDTCTHEKLTEFCPDTSRISVVYFEGDTLTYSDLNSRYIEGNAQIRLVGWFNMPALGNTDCNEFAVILSQLIDSIPFRAQNIDNVAINVSFIIGAVERGKDIFGQYTYDEKGTQYLMQPYEFCAINITVKFWVARKCAPVFEKGESLCE